MTVRRTVLRDDNGTVHNIPNSEIKIVSNLSRDWSELALNISVAYSADSDRVIKLLQEVGDELANDPDYSNNDFAKPEVPGIEKVSWRCDGLSDAGEDEAGQAR